VIGWNEFAKKKKRRVMRERRNGKHKEGGFPFGQLVSKVNLPRRDSAKNQTRI